MARPFSARSIFIACLVLVVLVLWALTVHSQSELQVGYATINADETSSLPVATALFSFRNAQGILVAEVGVEAVEPIRRGRIFVDQDGTRTGLALANSGDQSVTAALILRNAAGLEIDQSQLILEPREHIAVFVDELFPGALEDLTGSLTFETEAEEQRLAAVTLRQSNNVHGEPLLATLPVADLSELIAAATLQTPDSIVFPHIGAGASPNVILSTQIVLINPSSERLSGEIRLTASDGTPLQGELGGMVGSEFAYELEPEGTYRTTLTSSQAVVTGYAVVSLEEGSVLPVGTAIFQFRDDGGSLVSEAGVGATLPTTPARIFVDTVRTETGVAIASPGNDASTVTFELLDRNGFSIDSVDIEIPAAGHLALFANELFLLPLGFTGLMEIRSQVPMVPITLKLTTNQRGDSILTTLPVADLMRPSGATSLVIPQVGFGPDFSTRLIFIGTETEGRSRGHIVFTQSNGTELVVPVLGQASSDFPYLINPGGASQLRPGNTATVAEIVLDPSEPGLSEVVVNTGNTILLRPQILDTEGEFRDDFVLAYNSLDTGVATVDEVGSVTGGEQGFSTLTVSVEGVLRTATITVVKVTSGVSGFDITGGWYRI